MKLAAQLFTVRQFLKTPDDMARSLQKIKQIGYNSVQVSKIGPIEPAQFRKIADREGLSICATHVDFSEMQTKLSEVIEKHQIWDCKYVGVSILPAEYRSSADGLRAFAQEASEVGRKLNEAGLQFVYHNHNFEYAKFEGKTGMEILFQESDPSAFHFLIDLYWVQAGGANPIDWIHQLKGRMEVVHLKDMGVTADRQQFFAEVGEGNMNWPELLRACEECNVEWGVVEQDVCPGDPFESLAISLRNLERMGLQA